MAKVTLTFDERFVKEVTEFQAAFQADPKKAVASLTPMRVKYEALMAEATPIKELHDTLARLATFFGTKVETIETRGKKSGEKVEASDSEKV